MGLGDINTRQQEANNPYDDVRFGDLNKIASSIVREAPPTVTPEKIDEMMVLYRMLENLLNRHLVLTKRPGYLDPPFRGSVIDAYKNNDLALLAGAGNTNVLSITIQAGAILVISHIANQCEDLGAHADVVWNIFENGQPLNIQVVWFDGVGQMSTFTNFQNRMGLIDEPTALVKPLVFQGPSVFSLVASNPSVNNHWVNARLKGWFYVPGRASVEAETPLQIMT